MVHRSPQPKLTIQRLLAFKLYRAFSPYPVLRRARIMPAATQQTVNSFFAGTKAKVKKEQKLDDGEPEPKRAKVDQKTTEFQIKSTSNISDLTNDGLLKVNEPIPYMALTETFAKVEATTKRLEINTFLSEFFLKVLETNPSELSKVTYLFINRLGPDYEGLELGLGESLIIKALSEATGRSISQIKSNYHETGDLGLVALNSKKSQRTMFTPKPLTVTSVFESLTEIAKSTGQSSQNTKISVIRRLLTACKGNEPKFIVRSLEGKLRIGVAEKSVLTALAQAFVGWEKKHKNKNDSAATKLTVPQAEELFRDVHCQLPNYELIINAAIEHGVDKIKEHCKLTPGVPLKPMLAKPTKSITEVLDRFNNNESFTCEYKYDGERAQIHAENGRFYVYSRNSEDMSQRYPDILTLASKMGTNTAKHSSFILDCEAVAWDRVEKKILPFQILSTRKRKDVEEDSIKVRICLFVFDILYLNGELLLQKPLKDRRQILKDHFGQIEGEFAFAKSMSSENIDDIQAFLDQSIKDGCEGLMIKVLDGPESGYEPSKRSRNWLKLKKDYLSGVGDSLDLVVLGAYHGRGKRTGAYGGFLLGCYNADSEEYQTVCKIGTGFSDENLDKFYKELSELIVSEKKSYVQHDDASNQQPDIWFEPKVVWEILTADLSLSPVYRAGIDELGKGVSLRFPRFIRVRDDKGPEDATTTEQIVQFYQRQVSQHKHENGDEE